jgi:Ca2+-binding RTX toxin-like protein
MADLFLFSDFIVNTGNALDMSVTFQSLYVGAGATLASSAAGGRAVRSTADSVSVEVVGHLAAQIGVEFAGNFGSINIQVGGSVFGAGIGVDSRTSMALANQGTISARRGINCDLNLDMNNSGTVSGMLDAVFATGDATITNSGLITAPETAIFVNGVAHIVNTGTIMGGVSAQLQDDYLANAGLIVGDVFLGQGNDLFDGTDGRVLGLISMFAGDDTVLGGESGDVIQGGNGRDDLDGAAGDDRFVITDGDGHDVIDGGSGIDTYDARLQTLGAVVNLTTGETRSFGQTDLLTGIERVLGGAGNDRFTGDSADNLLRGGGGNDILTGMDGNDRIFGEAGRNNLYGGNGNDRITGGGGIDVIDGGAGDDRIEGSYDIDQMTGGTGADRFVFGDFDEFLPMSTSGLDKILDFVQGTDLIDLSAIDADQVLAGDQAFAFTGGAITGLAQIGFRTTALYTFVTIGYYAPSAFDIIRLDGVFALTAADFIL